MGAPTCAARVLVLRKTKLGESDLILTLMAADGSQLRAVAKGARKPTSSFASRLELYCVADVLLAKGRGLDIVKEARLVEGNDALRQSMERSAGAACVAELAERITQDGLNVARLFDATVVALRFLAREPERLILAATAAYLLKALSFAGLRPSLTACVACSRTLDLAAYTSEVRFSVIEGGVVCAACAPHVQTTPVPAETLRWAAALLGSTFAAIATMQLPDSVAFELLQLSQQWMQIHVGSSLKSLRFMTTSGVFSSI